MFKGIVLSRVIYELFEADLESLVSPSSDEEHGIDREIRLELSDGASKYISWCSDPVQYCVGVQPHSFFKPGGAVTRDVSVHPLWQRLIGEPLELVVLDANCQVLELRSSLASVFVSSQERGQWEADTLTVSGHNPLLGAIGGVPGA
jgi:hypothetical protein